jgi:cob(I)alamin adenosyltransferase
MIMGNVIISKITTKTGDSGETTLGDLTRVDKTDIRIRALAEIDMVNSALALVIEFNDLKDKKIINVLKLIQNHLFDLGADLATPITKGEKNKIRINDQYINYIEKQSEHYNKKLKPIKSFTLPASGKTPALLHNLRTTIRKAEIELWQALKTNKKSYNNLAPIYLNRLSDFIYILSRYTSKEEKLWVPGLTINHEKQI